MAKEARYVPALGLDVLTPLYDPLVALTTRERTFKRLLIAQAGVRAGQRVLDLACGTGTLAVGLKRVVPGAIVVDRFFEEAGFREVSMPARFHTPLGTIALYRAEKP